MRFSGHASPDAISSVAVAFVVLAGLTVALRLLTRIVFAHRAGLDDAFIAVAWVRTHYPVTNIYIANLCEDPRGRYVSRNVRAG